MPMSEPALKRTVIVANQAGMHLRAAVMMVTEAKRFKARDCALPRELHEVDATEMLQVMSFGAMQGEQVVAGGLGRRRGPGG